MRGSLLLVKVLYKPSRRSPAASAMARTLWALITMAKAATISCRSFVSKAGVRESAIATGLSLSTAASQILSLGLNTPRLRGFPLQIEGALLLTYSPRQVRYL